MFTTPGDDSKQTERLHTGTPGLDDVLNGGLISNQVYLIEGAPGAGKTTLALQFLMEGVEQEESGLYITLCETKVELQGNAESHGWSLNGIEILELTAESSELDGDRHVTMFFPFEVELTDTTKKILQVVEQTKPRRVVFDSLSELKLLTQSALRYRRQIQALKQFFLGRNCTVLMLDGQQSDASDLHVQSIAHGVILLEQHSTEFGRARHRLRVQKFRDSRFRGGFHDVEIEETGLVVYPRMISTTTRRPFENSQIASGIDDLDEILGGGPDRGTCTVLNGPTGIGKSTIAYQYVLAAAARGECAAIFSFDSSVQVVEARIQSLNRAAKLSFDSKNIKIFAIDPAEITPGEFTHMVRNAVEFDRVSIIVIDSLNGYLDSMPEEFNLTSHLHELLKYLNRCGVTTLLSAAKKEVLRIASARAIDTNHMADSVILLRYFELEGKLRKAITVLKKRTGPHDHGIHEIQFEKNGIQLSTPTTHLYSIFTELTL